MMSEVNLLDFVAQAFPVGVQIDAADLQRLLDELGIPNDSLVVQELIESAIREIESEGAERLDFGPSGWKVKVTETSIHSAISGAIIYGLTAALSLNISIPAALVTALIPRLFAIERVTLTRAEKQVVASLQLRDEVRLGTSEMLYSKLPNELQDKVNFDDFRDLLDKTLQSGHAAKRGTALYKILPSSRGRFVVTIV